MLRWPASGQPLAAQHSHEHRRVQQLQAGSARASGESGFGSSAGGGESQQRAAHVKVDSVSAGLEDVLDLLRSGEDTRQHQRERPTALHAACAERQRLPAGLCVQWAGRRRRTHLAEASKVSSEDGGGDGVPGRHAYRRVARRRARAAAERERERSGGDGEHCRESARNRSGGEARNVSEQCLAGRVVGALQQVLQQAD